MVGVGFRAGTGWLMPLGQPSWVGGSDGESVEFQPGGASFMTRLGSQWARYYRCEGSIIMLGGFLRWILDINSLKAFTCAHL